MPLTDLASPPPAVADANRLIADLDQALTGGFARLGESHLGALESLCRTFARTPLESALRTAVDGIVRSEFLDRHFLVLAAARAALQGAQHDALVAQLASALERPPPRREELPAAATQALPPQIEVWLESTRHWLMELALAGFSNLTTDTILPFQATLDAIAGDGRLPRHAALLGGFQSELLSVFPTRGTPQIPLGRWADLWTRAMILAARAPVLPPTRPVSGELRLLGADLRQHDTFATVVAFGVLREPGKEPRLVRTAVSAFKVDVIQGEELGPLLADVGGTLLQGLAGFRQLSLTKMPLLSTGDLLWQEGSAKLGAAFDPLAEAAAVLSSAPAERPVLDPADRHPALIEELVYLSDYKVGSDGDALTLNAGGASIPVDAVRCPETDDLEPADVKGSTALVGLLRFDDGRWSLQPLAVGKKKPPLRAIGQSLGATKGKKAATGALPTLKERASKLLRKS